jgi:hypothetical protein
MKMSKIKRKSETYPKIRVESTSVAYTERLTGEKYFSKIEKDCGSIFEN